MVIRSVTLTVQIFLKGNRTLKKTISMLVFIVALPAVVITVVVFLNNNNQSNAVVTTFPYQPDEVINKNWVAIVFKTECRHCNYLLADLSDIYKNNPIDIYAFSKSSKEETDEFLSNFKIPFPVIYTKENFREQLKTRSVPTMFLIDENNKVKHKFVGRKSKNDLEDLFNEYFKSGKILMNSLSSTSFSTKNSQLNDIWGIINNDTSFIAISEQFSENIETTTELLSIKRKNNQDIVYNYSAYYPNCECDEDEAEYYTYFSIIIDGITNITVNQYFSDSIEKEEIVSLIANNNNNFSNYAN